MFGIDFYIGLAIILFFVNYCLDTFQVLRGRKDLASGDIILKYGLRYKAFVVITAMLLVFNIADFIHTAITDPSTIPVKRSEIVWLALFFLFFISMGAFLLAFYFGQSYRLTGIGLEKYWFNRKVLQLDWQDIDAINKSTFGSDFIVYSRKGKARLSPALDGLKDFAEAVKNNLPYEKWAKAAESIDKLLAKESKESLM